MRAWKVATPSMRSLCLKPASTMRTSLITITASLSCLASFSYAEPNIEFSGFATFAFSSSNTEYETDQGINEDWSIYPNSAVGIQSAANLNDRTRFILQIEGRGHQEIVNTGQSEFEPDIEWAFVHLQASETSSFRIGRFQNPSLMYSDVVSVSYAYLWVTPPREVYQLAPDTRIDGLSYDFQYFIKSWQLGFSIYGTTDFEQENASIEDRAGTVLSLQNDQHLFRISAAKFKLSVDTPSAIQNSPFCPTKDFGIFFGCAISAIDNNTFNQLNPDSISSISNKLSSQDMKIEFFSLGYEYDNSDLIIASELSELENASAFLHDSRAGYLTIGYRFNTLTPHLTLAKAKTTDDRSRNFNQYTHFTGLNPVYAALDDQDQNGSVSTAEAGSYLRSTNENRESATLGLRWDYAKRTALKADFTYINNFKDSNGFFSEAKDPTDKYVWIYRLAFTSAF